MHFECAEHFETSASITKFINISLCIFVISEFIPFSETPWPHGMVWYVCFCSLPQGSSWQTSLINHNTIWSSDLSKYNVHPIKDKCLKLLVLDSQHYLFCNCQTLTRRNMFLVYMTITEPMQHKNHDASLRTPNTAHDLLTDHISGYHGNINLH